MRKKIVIMLLVVILFILPFGVSYFIYQDNFSNRFETGDWLIQDLEDYEGLKLEEVDFKSNNDQNLKGFIYSKDDIDPKGLIVISHGLGGGGQNSYMDIADYFASHGYMVFSYDVTGNDKSEGDSINGLPQAVIDLDYALQYIKEDETMKALPIMLFGQSWGGYAAGNVLNVHPDVESIVMISGFNKSVDLIEEEGQKMMGKGMKLLVPYLSLVERVKFGSYAGYSCVKGLENTQANVFILHSKDDNVVSYNNHYEMFMDRFSENDKFSFKSYENKGHSFFLYTEESETYYTGIYNEFWNKIRADKVDYSYELEANYMNEHFDKTKFYDLDYDLLDSVIAFYNKSGRD